MTTRALSSTVNGGRVEIAGAGGAGVAPGVAAVAAVCATGTDALWGTTGERLAGFAAGELFPLGTATRLSVVARTGATCFGDFKMNHNMVAMAMAASGTHAFFMT